MGITTLAWAAAMVAAAGSEYHFCTPDHFIALTVEHDPPYAGQPINIYSADKRLCPFGRCVEHFSGSIARLRYGFAPARPGAPAAVGLREQVQVFERSADVPEEPSPRGEPVPVKDGMVTDIQLFGYDEDRMTPAEREVMRQHAKTRMWRRVRQDLFLNGDRQPFATIEWKHTLGAITIERMVAPAACALPIEQMFQQAKFAEVQTMAPALIAATQDPVLKARRLLFLGSAEHWLEEYRRAVQTLESGLALIEKHSTPQAAEINVALLTRLGEVMTLLGRFDEANARLRRALEAADETLEPGHAVRLQLHVALGQLAVARNQLARAQSETRKALAIAENQLGQSYRTLAAVDSLHPEALRARFLLGLFQTETDPAEAETVMASVVDAWRARFPSQRRELGHFLQGLAKVKARQGDLPAALRLSAEALGVLSVALGPEHPATVSQTENHAAFLRAAKRGKEARRLEHEAASVRRRHGRPSPEHTVDAFSLRRRP